MRKYGRLKKKIMKKEKKHQLQKMEIPIKEGIKKKKFQLKKLKI